MDEISKNGMIKETEFEIKLNPFSVFTIKSGRKSVIIIGVRVSDDFSITFGINTGFTLAI